MLYKPSQGAIWDPSVFWADGSYYAVFMYHPPGDKCTTCGFISHSQDGVHWTDGWPITPEPTARYGGHFYKAFIHKIGGTFFMNHGVREPNAWQDMLRFYESPDLVNWTYIASTQPDPRWFEPTGRWDHMYVIPKDEAHPDKGCWGYPVATTRSHLPRGCALTQTVDGRFWETVGPVPIEWGDIPSMDLEIGGVERIGDKFIMIGGFDSYLSDGYSMYTFIADDPRGPFKPDRHMFRLCGSSGLCANGCLPSILAAWVRGKDGQRLISNSVKAPSGVWMLPLRNPVMEDGHLRLGWWPENDALKKDVIDLPTRQQKLSPALQQRQTSMLLDYSQLPSGMILEGKFRCDLTEGQGSVGFVFDEGANRCLEIRLIVEASGRRLTVIGRYNIITGFTPADITAEGCATVRGFSPGQVHRFRLLASQDVFELYLDDLLAQTFIFNPAHCRIGLVATDGAQASFTELQAWKMSPGTIC